MFTMFFEALKYLKTFNWGTEISSGFIKNIFRMCLEDNERLMSLKQYEGE